MPVEGEERTEFFSKFKLWKQKLGVLLLSYETYFRLIRAQSQQLQEMKHYLISGKKILLNQSTWVLIH